jgi:hypothetical protein
MSDPLSEVLAAMGLVPAQKTPPNDLLVTALGILIQRAGGTVTITQKDAEKLTGWAFSKEGKPDGTFTFTLIPVVKPPSQIQ